MITFRRKITWDDLPKMGLVMGDIRQLTWRPGPITEMEFNDPAKEAELQAETEALAAVNSIIDGITTLAGAKVFLKRLCKRLIANGVLP